VGAFAGRFCGRAGEGAKYADKFGFARRMYYLCEVRREDPVRPLAMGRVPAALFPVPSFNYGTYAKISEYPAPALRGVCADGAAAEEDAAAALERGRDLFDFGRWSDARHEFLRARAASDPADRTTVEEIDFYLAACAVELGSADAEGALRDFEERYPGSVYANDVRFALGSFYCSAGNMREAREAFERTEYRALSAPRREQYDIRMGYVEFTDGDYEAAYGHFDRIGSRSEYADHALYYKSYIDYAEGRSGRAKQGFTQLALSDAYRDVVPFYLMQIEFREGNYRYVVEQGPELARKAVPERRAELERVTAESWFRSASSAPQARRSHSAASS